MRFREQWNKEKVLMEDGASYVNGSVRVMSHEVIFES